MFNSITIDNFRGIKHLQLDGLKQVNLFVGGNNSGKTSVMEALFVMTKPAEPSLFTKPNYWRGLNNVNTFGASLFWKIYFYNLNVKEEISLSVNYRNTYPEDQFTLALCPHFKAKIESFETSSNINTQREIENLAFTTKRNAQVIAKGNIATKKIMKDGALIGVSTDTVYSLKHNPDKKMLFETNARYIHTKLASEIKQKAEDFDKKNLLEGVKSILKKVEPRLNGLYFYSDGIYSDLGFSERVPINIMGDGMYKILECLVSMRENQNGIIFIDEIENGLYPDTQKVLWEAIFQAAEEFNVQVFATTHSLDCLNTVASTYEKIGKKENAPTFQMIRLEKQENQHTAVYISPERLSGALENQFEIR